MDKVGDFRHYVEKRQRGLLRTAWLLTGSWSSAEDLVQTALAKAWPRWDHLRDDALAHAYVRRILLTTSHDWHARRWRLEEPTAALPEPVATDEGSAVDARLVLLGAVRSLPPKQRAVIVLRYFDDATEADTAAVLGCTVGTVKSQTSKALITLRRYPGLTDLLLQGSAS